MSVQSHWIFLKPLTRHTLIGPMCLSNLPTVPYNSGSYFKLDFDPSPKSTSLRQFYGCSTMPMPFCFYQCKCYQGFQALARLIFQLRSLALSQPTNYAIAFLYADDCYLVVPASSITNSLCISLRQNSSTLMLLKHKNALCYLPCRAYLKI